MSQRHIAIVTLLANGHVHPILPLCSQLVHRGYRVSCPTSAHFSDKIKKAGAEPIIFTDRRMSEEMIEGIRRAFASPSGDPMWWDWSAALQLHNTDAATEILSQIQDFYRNNKPNLILYDRWIFYGRLLAKELDCPVAQMSPHFAYFNNMMSRSDGICRNPYPMRKVSKEVDAFFAGRGLVTQDCLWHTEELNIHFIPRAFQHNSDYFDQRFYFSGALLRAPSSTWKNNSNGRPLVLISDLSGLQGLGVNAKSYFNLFVDALCNVECHCVLSIGDSAGADSLGPLPPNFELNQGASHLEILPHAALAVCHGGMGSTLEAIYHGVPVLACPPHPWCEEVAYRLVELGLGTRLPRYTLTSEMIRATVLEMLGDAKLLNRVKVMQQLFMRSGGVEGAVDQIERFLERSRIQKIRS